jgi:hypothetical protein
LELLCGETQTPIISAIFQKTIFDEVLGVHLNEITSNAGAE